MTIAEQLKKVSSTKKVADRKALLKEYNSLALRNVIKGALDDKVEWDLPEGAPPYEPFTDESKMTTLEKSSAVLGKFVKHKVNAGLNPVKKETMFIELLRSLPEDEAELIVAMKDKQWPYKNIKVDMVREVFPGLLSS